MKAQVGSAYRFAETKRISVGGVDYAYRALGAGDHTPVVLFNHWGANLDNFDPPIVDGLAADRPVIALDYRGIGGSGGAVRTSVQQSAQDMIAVIRALAPRPVDVFGFSLGGFVAQEIVLTAPDLVRRVILAGTAPAGGKGGDEIGGVTIRAILKALLTRRDPKFYLFFTESRTSREAAREFLARLDDRTADRDKPVGPRALYRQFQAINAWSKQSAQPLESIEKPVLIANGDQDAMVPSDNSISMAKRIPSAELVLYPDAGHGGIFQHHEAFTRKARAFLSD